MKEYAIYAAREDKCFRKHKIKPHGLRSDFDRDRDRILYSKAFRRLSGKTQVFVVGNGDHIRTRLTHTLEVSQLAGTIGKYFGFNETLIEAISLGHDIGHTPFGHVGERTLNYIMNGCYGIKEFNKDLCESEKGFKHNLQGIRVVSELEISNRDYKGLNLTDFTMWGIINHSGTKYKKCRRKSLDGKCNLKSKGQVCIAEECNLDNGSDFGVGFYEKYKNELHEDSWTMEGLIVAVADEIAQRHHDIEDGLEAGIIDIKELLDFYKKCFGRYINKDDEEIINKLIQEKNSDYVVYNLSRLIINLYTQELIKNTNKNLMVITEKFNLSSEEDFYNNKINIKDQWGLKNIVCYDDEFQSKDNKFQNYLRSRILNSYKVQSMDGKADYIIRKLFKAYVSSPQQLPDMVILNLYRNILPEEEFNKLEKDNSYASLIGYLRDSLEQQHFVKCDTDYKVVLLRVICDYIASMTDNYALKQYDTLYSARSDY